MADRITELYEARQIREQNAVARYIDDVYRKFVSEVAPLIASGAADATIKRKVDQLLRRIRKDMASRVEVGVQRAWMISNDKTFAYLDKRLKGTNLPENIKSAFYDQNAKAMQEFIKRKDGGLNLSDRIWKGIKGTKKIINKKLSDGTYAGKNAASVARSLRKELLNPSGEIAPGQGVYKSPIKNAMRLARTETNMAYRMADHSSWKDNPAILGYRISLSQTGKAKARCELCRQMAGDYPSSFVWAGWHPNCLCVKTPILMNRQHLDDYNDLIVSGRATPQNIAALRKKAGAIEQPPALLKSWVSSNAERVSGWKSIPFWWNDNIKLINTYI